MIHHPAAANLTAITMESPKKIGQGNGGKKKPTMTSQFLKLAWLMNPGNWTEDECNTLEKPLIPYYFGLPFLLLVLHKN